LSRPDLLVIGLYFLVTLGIGFWATRRQETAGDYFLGARNLPAWAVLLSIVATETSALTVISVPGIGARGDLGFLQLTFGFLAGRIGVALWLLPGYFRGDQETAYARLESRFGTATRRLVSVVFLVTRFLGDGVRIFAGAIPLALVTGWSIPVAIVAMGGATLVYTYFGGLKAVVWADVVQLAVYLGLIGGAMLSAASHGTDQLIVQRLLATRSLQDARTALVGSGVVVILQFLLFLLVGSAIWAAGLAPNAIPADQIFPRFILDHLPAGLAGLVVAGILAAAMSTISSSINALASSMTHDLYAGWSGRREPTHLLRVGRLFSAVWGTGLVLSALFFQYYAGGTDTPVVVLALSVASITYGGLLGTYILAGSRRTSGRDVVGAVGITVVAMLLVVFAKPLSASPAFSWLAPAARLAWPWYVPLGTLIAVGTGVALSYLPHGKRKIGRR
jgi:Na+/proline symporter